MLFARMLIDKVGTKKEVVAWGWVAIIDVEGLVNITETNYIKMRGGVAFEMKAMVKSTC